MRILGADFSGSTSPQITLAVGTLEERRLSIETLYPCDDRLDLFHAIAYNRIEPQLCGLDFPFALPGAAMQRLGVEHLYELTLNHSRSSFAVALEGALGRFEGRCREPSTVCRVTDALCAAYSGIKRVNPSLVQMLYSGSRLLFYLWDDGVMPYPLAQRGTSQVCEVYPSHTWAQVGLKRSTDLITFVERFNALGIIEVALPTHFETAATQDIADSVVACITTAAVQYRDNIHADWATQPTFATDAEWAVAQREGIIVRV